MISFFYENNTFANIFGPDTRISISPPQKELFHVVSVEVIGKEKCSGSIIGPNLILTAAHCVLPALTNPIESNFENPVANRPNRNLEVKYGQHAGKFLNFSSVKKVYVGLSSMDHYGTDYYKDYAILELNKPFGDIFGFLSLDASPGTESLMTKDLSISSYDLEEWASDNRGNPYAVFNQTMNSHCNFRQYFQNGVFYHDCATERGSSGAPIMKCDLEENCTIIALNIAENRDGGRNSLHLKEYSEDFTNYALNLKLIEPLVKILLKKTISSSKKIYP